MIENRCRNCLSHCARCLIPGLNLRDSEISKLDKLIKWCFFSVLYAFITSGEPAWGFWANAGLWYWFVRLAKVRTVITSKNCSKNHYIKEFLLTIPLQSGIYRCSQCILSVLNTIHYLQFPKVPAAYYKCTLLFLAKIQMDTFSKRSSRYSSSLPFQINFLNGKIIYNWAWYTCLEIRSVYVSFNIARFAFTGSLILIWLWVCRTISTFQACGIKVLLWSTS